MQVLFNDPERDSVLKEFVQIDCFKEIETERSIFCKSWWTYQYAVFLKNTHLTMNVSLDQENTDLTFFVFSPLQSDINSLSLIADIQASNVELHIVFISLQGNDANLKMNGDIIEDLAFVGHGCAISQASTSIMIDTLRGKTIYEAKEIIANQRKEIKHQPKNLEEQFRKYFDILRLFSD